MKVCLREEAPLYTLAVGYDSRLEGRLYRKQTPTSSIVFIILLRARRVLHRDKLSGNVV